MVLPRMPMKYLNIGLPHIHAGDGMIQKRWNDCRNSMNWNEWPSCFATTLITVFRRAL